MVERSTRLPEGISEEFAANLAFYRTARAVAQFSEYRLHRDEEYIFPRYYKPGDRLLDLACGMGRTTLLLHEMGLQVKGIDRSDVFIEITKRRFPYLDLRLGSYDCIDEPDRSFSHVLISHNGIDCATPVTQRITALRECLRVLKPGGTLIYSSHNIKSLHWFSPYYRARLLWKFRNCIRALKEWDYVFEDGEYLFYGSTGFVVHQAEDLGFQFVEARGFTKIPSIRLDHYFSPYLLYVFRSPAR
jgi:ubiquinone/menaquinone biosynthesis C-methylase UbiE